MASDEQESEKSDSPLLFIIGRLFDLAGTVIKGILDWKTLGIFCVLLLGYVALLPAADRSKLEGLGQLAAAVERSVWSAAVSVMGWVLLFVVVCVLGPALWVANRRIKTQGAELIRLREKNDPNRLSAGNQPAMEARAKEIVTEIRANQNVEETE